MLTTIAMIALSPTALEPVDFVHDFKKGQTLTYELAVDGDPGGQTFEVRGTLSIVVEKLNEDGSVEVSFDSPDMTVNGEADPVPEATLTLNKNGVVKNPEFGGEQTPFILVSLAMALPGAKLEEGASYEHKLQSDTITYSSKGTFGGWEERDGVKLAHLAAEGAFSAMGMPEENAKQNLYFNPATKRIVHASLDLGMMGGSFFIELKLKK